MTSFPSLIRSFQPFYLTTVFAIAVFLGGCKTARDYRVDADETAYSIIEEGQKEALGKTEPLNIEPPAETLRRRLLEDQDLPIASDASKGAKALEEIDGWPGSEDYLESSGGEGANVVTSPSLEGEVNLTLFEALKVAAANSREYQSQKESVFQAALALDLESNEFRTTFSGMAESVFTGDLEGTTDAEGRIDNLYGVENTGEYGVQKTLKNGAALTSAIGIDLVRLFSQSKDSVRGLFADATVTVPLLRGAGKKIVTEPLTQAQRDVIYAMYDFERFKRTFSVEIADSYLGVLQQLDEVENAEENYRGLVTASRRARRLADAGRLPEIQVDQALQDELRARNRWISAQQSYVSGLDSFKIQLGLPTDASVSLDSSELDRLSGEFASLLERFAETEETTALEEEAVAADAPVELEQPDREHGGPYEIPEDTAVDLALENRLDLRQSIGEVVDSQRSVYVAADLLRAELTLGGSGTIGQRRTLGSVASEDSKLYPDQGSYNGSLILDLPLERTEERNIYRRSLIDLEAAVRNAQQTEDQIKLQVRNGLRDLLEFRETLMIQTRSLELAERRVESTNLFLQAGRAEIRDLLEAQEALISAQNSLTSALVNYRISELELQRDLGMLEVTGEGVWQEVSPDRLTGLME